MRVCSVLPFVRFELRIVCFSRGKFTFSIAHSSVTDCIHILTVHVVVLIAYRTPLQNNLHELWALLNFLLPDIFSSAEQFDEWFDLDIEDEEQKKNIISQLHKILRPFMLRRLKVDVAKGLPPKTETILMVGMSKIQKKLYKQLLLRDLDSITGNVSNKNRTAVLNIVMQLRKCCGHPYLFEGVEDR
jgi:SWI/SNF-related matrix-associated actin-dependent regulator of chromatin subfamily A member 5